MAGKERQQRLIRRRQTEGLRRTLFWASEADLEHLRDRFPGPRGGIDWTAVVRAALALPRVEPHRPGPAQPLIANVLGPRDPLPYWKPDPLKPSDPRCQAQNRDGQRCRARTAVLVRARNGQGQLGEFCACKRHQSEFRPHPGVLVNPPAARKT
jgi:hypothetical protein